MENKKLFTEVSKADSSLYEGYNFRPYNPDSIYQKRMNYTIFDDIKEDDQIASLLHLKKLFILDTKWEIECENEEIKLFLEEALTEVSDGIDKGMYAILSALDYGFSLTEKIFKVTSKGKIVLDRLKTRAPHSFTIYQDEYGNITRICQDTSSGPELELDKDKFIHFIYQREFDNPYGKSEINKGIYTDWWSKSAILKFWNIYLERFGMPTAHGKYPVKYEGQIDDFKKVLSNIQAKTSIVTPNDIEIQLLEASKGGETFQTAINYYNTAIARKMLIPDLMGFSGQQISGGSYALGREQFGMFYNVIETIRNDLERTINLDLVKPLTEWNFGNSIEASFRFMLVDEAKKQQNLQTWLQWVQMGKPISDEATDWFYQQVEVPKGELKEQPQIGGSPFGPMFTKEEMQFKKFSPFEKKKEVLKYDYNEEEINELTKKVDFAKIEKELDDVELRIKKKLADAYKKEIENIIKQAEEIIDKNDIEAINDMTVNEESFKKAMKEIVFDAYDSGAKSAEIQVRKNEEVLNDDDIAAWLEQNAFYVSDEEAAYILKISKPIIANGIRQGLGIKQIVKQLEDAFSDVGINGNRLNTVARTTISTSYNEGRFREYEKVEDEIQGYFYSIILDGRTSEICKRLNSNVQGVYKPADGRKINPPNHFNCRSVLVPVFKDEKVSKWATIPGNFKQSGSFFNIV